MAVRTVLYLSALAAAAGLRLGLPSLPPTASAISRHAGVRCGFEVDSVDQKAIDELDVFNWPGLEKRKQDFAESAVPGKLKMVYVKQGSATVEDDDETASVCAGDMVLIDDRGEVRWSGISEGGLILLSCETALDDDNAPAAAAAPPAAGAKDLSGRPLGNAMQEEIGDLSLGGLAIQLGLGLASGAMLAVGLKLFITPDQ